MPKITVKPVEKVKISICVADLDSSLVSAQKAIFSTMVDEITASFVPSGFIDPCRLNRHGDWLDIGEEIGSDDAGDFVQKVCQAYKKTDGPGFVTRTKRSCHCRAVLLPNYAPPYLPYHRYTDRPA